MLLVVIASMFNVSCTGNEKLVSSNTLAHFNLEEVLDAEVAKDSILSVEKSVTMAGKTEVQNHENYHLKNDIEILKSFDIYSPNLIGKYIVDTIKSEVSSGSVIRYKAVDEAMKIQLLEVILDENNELIACKGSRLSDTPISKWVQNMVYEPNKGYSLEKTNRLIFEEESTSILKVTFK